MSSEIYRDSKGDKYLVLHFSEDSDAMRRQVQTFINNQIEEKDDGVYVFRVPGNAGLLRVGDYIVHVPANLRVPESGGFTPRQATYLAYDKDAFENEFKKVGAQ